MRNALLISLAGLCLAGCANEWPCTRSVRIIELDLSGNTHMA
jgi:hypothetical protein